MLDVRALEEVHLLQVSSGIKDGSLSIEMMVQGIGMTILIRDPCCY